MDFTSVQKNNRIRGKCKTQDRSSKAPVRKQSAERIWAQSIGIGWTHILGQFRCLEGVSCHWLKTPRTVAELNKSDCHGHELGPVSCFVKVLYVKIKNIVRNANDRIMKFARVLQITRDYIFKVRRTLSCLVIAMGKYTGRAGLFVLLCVFVLGTDGLFFGPVQSTCNSDRDCRPFGSERYHFNPFVFMPF